MENTVDGAEDGQPAADAVRRRHRSREAEQTEGDETAPCLPAEDVPADSVPHGDTPHVTVERQHVAGENGRERPGAAAPRQPAHDEHGHGHPRRAPEGEGADHGGVTRAEGHHGRAEYPEESGLGLEHDAGTRGEASPHHGPSRAPRLPDAGGAPRREHEKEREEKIALARPPRSSREVIEREEEGSGETAPRVTEAPRKAEERPRGEDEPSEVEEPPRPVALAQHRDQAQVQEIDARHVHVEDVAVGHGALRDQPRHVVHQGSVVHERPAPGSPAEIECHRSASGQNRLQSLARRSG